MLIQILICRGALDEQVASGLEGYFHKRGNTAVVEKTENTHMSAAAAFGRGADAVVVLGNQTPGNLSYGVYVPLGNGAAIFDARDGFSMSADDAMEHAISEHIERLKAAVAAR